MLCLILVLSDYSINLQDSIQFTPTSSSEICRNATIIMDDIIESSEEFVLQLDSNMEPVIVPNSAVVLIFDNTSKHSYNIDNEYILQYINQYYTPA